MRLFKSKKGIELWIGLIMTIIVATGAAYIAFMSRNLKEPSGYLGEDQVNQLKINNKARKIDLFVKQSAKYSIYQVIYDLAEIGGRDDCDEYFGYSLWNSEDKECYPDEGIIKKNFIEKFKEEFDGYLKLYPEPKIPLNNYDVLLKDSDGLEIVGFATNNIVYPMKDEKYIDWEKKIIEKLPDDQKKCLEKNKNLKEGEMSYVFDLKEGECIKCSSEAGCEKQYRTEYYCDLDPCNLNCVGGFMKQFVIAGKKVYLKCMKCPVNAECSDYIDEEYCNKDPCDLNCIWVNNACEKQNIMFSIKLSFYQKIDYNLNDYNIIKKYAKRLVSTCSEENDLKNCIVKEIAEYNSEAIKEETPDLYWSFDKDCSEEDDKEEDKNYIFCVKTDEKFLAYDKLKDVTNYFKLKEITVVIDPGHGGSDPGAKGEVNGKKVYEKDIVLSISKKLKEELGKTGMNVILTRDSDKKIDLSKRAKIANEANADLFISIHTNAAFNNKTKGTEVWIDCDKCSSKNEYDIDKKKRTKGCDPISFCLQSEKFGGSEKLAEFVVERITKELGTEKRGVRAVINFMVLDKTKMPAILIEVAFISNPSEATKLANPVIRDRVAKEISKAIEEYFIGVEDKEIKLREIIIKFALYLEPTQRNLIFTPVNWDTGESDFRQKAKTSFDYFIKLANSKGDQTTYNPIYQFSDIQITDFERLTAAVEKLENHVKALGIPYDKNNDVIVAYTNDLGESEGFIHTPYNQVVFSTTEHKVLEHELGHALFGYCEEYEYFDIECPDLIEHRDLVEKAIYDNIELVTNLFWDIGKKDISYQEIVERISEMKDIDEYVSKYPDTDEGTDRRIENLFNAIVECNSEGWLVQHYDDKYFYKNFKDKYPRIFNGCQNEYPICCMDSPNYKSDTSTGINCYSDNYDVEAEKQLLIDETQADPSLTEAEKQEEINFLNTLSREEFLEIMSCAGSSCGPNCRSIMGASDLDYPITLRRYPIG